MPTERGCVAETSRSTSECRTVWSTPNAPSHADLLIEPCDEQIAAMLHEAVGEGGLFAQRTGYHADILRPEIIETLPSGWETRLVKLDKTAAAFSPEDLLVVKLRAGFD